jgi:HlyD family secretion protein
MVDAFPGERFKGKVRQIRNAAQTVQNVVTYDAVIDVDNLDLKLRPGMTANVNFIFANREDVLRVPNAALRFRPSPELQAALKLEAGKRGRSAEEASVNREAVSAPASRAGDRPSGRPRPGAGGGAAGTSDEAPNQKSVWVLRDGAPQQTRIKTSTSDGTKTEVLEGPLAEGDLVITDATLSAGSKPAAGLLPGTPAPPRGGGGPRPF